ncbi:MAG TPA: pitrilysin family protein [Balneolales bacterium]|nr:pitrilysin family protein [Balneolales bacterium]
MHNMLQYGKYRSFKSKNLSITALFAILAVFISLPSCFGATRKGPEKDNVLRATLKNGLRVVIVRNDLAPVVTTEINYLVGSNEAPKGYPGTAHALEHMMFRGSKGLDANQLADIGAAMGGDFDADTRQNVTQYFFTVPSNDLDIALHIGAIRMRNVLCTDSLWTNERGAIEQEVARDLSDPEYVVYTKLLKAMYKGTPYAHDALGTRPSFNKTTGKMLRDFHDTWYAPNNAILIVVGNVNPQEALQKVKSLFENIPSSKLPAKPSVNLGSVTSDTLRSPVDLPYGLTYMTFRMPGTDSPDFPAAEILSDVLSSQRGNLYGLVPQGKALYTEFALNGLPKSGLGFAVGVFSKGSNPKELVSEMHSVLAGYLKNGVPADLVAAAKRHELADAEFQKNSISGLANAWSEAVAVDGKKSPQAEVNELKNVTVADVNRVARKYLKFDHAIYAIMTPQQSGKPISQKSYGGAESFAPKNPKPVELPSWAKNAMGRMKVPKSIVNPTVYHLKNGIKLIVQPESISNTVSLYGSIKHNPDLEVPKDQEGVSSILEQLFDYGSTSLNRIAFQKALDDIGANESAGTGFSLQVLKKDFNKGVQLLSDNMLHPGLPARAFKVIQMQTSRSVAGELNSPDYLTGRALTKALVPPQDPTLRHATPGSIDSLSLSDVKNYYSKVFRPDLTTIVVIGNIKPEEAKSEIEKYFGRWKANGPKPKTELSSIPVNKPSTTTVPDKSKVQDGVSLAENLKITRSNPDYYALELGNHVLGGGFYATRLYKDLRENSGLVYYVSSSFSIGKHRSTYKVDYGCDPPNVSKARAIIIRDLKEMQDNLVTDKELNQAKSTILRDIQLSESSTGSIAHGLLSRSLNDLPLNEPTLAAQKYINLNAKQVKEAFAKWVRPDDFVQITEGPNPQ